MSISDKITGLQDTVAEGLRVLAKQRFSLVVHDSSFPSLPEQDTGRGSPYSRGGLAFLGFARSLGFDTIQLGPQGLTTRYNPSPYDGTIFSRNVLSIDPWPLADERWAGLLGTRTLQQVLVRSATVGGRGFAPSYGQVWDAQQHMLREAYISFLDRRRQLRAGRLRGKQRQAVTRLVEELHEFIEMNRVWLDRDALFEAFTAEYGHDCWWRWAEEEAADGHGLPPVQAALRDAVRAGPSWQAVYARHRSTIDFYRFCQFIVHRQQKRWRAEVDQLGLRVFGDLQIGLSQRDIFSFQGLLLQGYRMGAPPSRTNPSGQPWGYPVLSPDFYHDPGSRERGAQRPLPGPAIQLVLERLNKLFDEVDGVRIDHPHGLVCPWVYRCDIPDPFLAVQQGARLFDSPGLPDHPELDRFAIVRRDQLNPRPGTTRYADDWVVELDAEQVERYSVVLDAIVQSAADHGRDRSAVVVETLSTMPLPLRRAMERHGMGRFRVTQKADPRRPDDVYRSENAAPADWIMVGNHDTAPLWRVVEGWEAAGTLGDRALYLAERLVPDARARPAFAASLAAHPERLASAMFADLFASPAGNVMVFFADLLGMLETYNEPGTVNDTNWMLRVPNDFEHVYLDKLARGRALNVPESLAQAIRARGKAFAAQHAGLIARLDALAEGLRSTTAPPVELAPAQASAAP